MALTDGLLAYWDFEEASGNLLDKTGNGFDGVVSGATYGANGIIGDCYDFDGGTDVVAVEHNDLIPTGTNDFTVACWAYSEGDTPTWQAYIENEITDDFWFASKYSTDNTILYCAGGVMVAGDGNGPNGGAWYFMVATRDGTTSTDIYMNTNNIKTGSTAGNVDAADVNIGNGNLLANGFNGRLDEMGVWNRVLSSAEITELYNSGAGLTYPFGESTGTNMQINIGDTWKAVASMQVNVGDAWKAVKSAQINIGDTWKTIF